MLTQETLLLPPALQLPELEKFTNLHPYGIDAWDDTRKREDEETQATWDLMLWEEIRANSAVCSGGFLFNYSDEWWKVEKGSPSVHDVGGFRNAAFPDGFMNEEWWGIMRLSKNGSLPDILEARKVYSLFRKAWSREGAHPGR